MEKIRAIRGGHRSSATRLINKTEEKLSNSDFNVQELAATIDTLMKKRDLLQTLDNQVLESSELEDFEQEILDTDEYNLQLEFNICKYQDIVSKPQSTDTSQNCGEWNF